MKIEDAYEILNMSWGYHSGEDQEAIGVAMEALKKQIPKKPTESADTYEQYRCPVCDTCVGIWDLQHRTVIKENYCQHCGQKIMWEEEDEDGRGIWHRMQ